jgi:hypothetical protein
LENIFRKHRLFRSVLGRPLGVKKEKTYNGVLLEKELRTNQNLTGKTSQIYIKIMGICSTVNAVEVKTVNDTID